MEDCRPETLIETDRISVSVSVIVPKLTSHAFVLYVADPDLSQTH